MSGPVVYCAVCGSRRSCETASGLMRKPRAVMQSMRRVCTGRDANGRRPCQIQYRAFVDTVSILQQLRKDQPHSGSACDRAPAEGSERE